MHFRYLSLREPFPRVVVIVIVVIVAVIHVNRSYMPLLDSSKIAYIFLM